MVQTFNCSLKNHSRELSRVSVEVETFLESSQAPQRIQFVVSMALEEILTNIIKYGYDDSEDHDIEVRIEVGEKRAELTFIDDGHKFDPGWAPEPDMDKPAMERKIGGVGLHLVKEMTDRVDYHRIDGLNHLIVSMSWDG